MKKLKQKLASVPKLVAEYLATPRWFELLDYFDPQAIRPVNLAATKSLRVFFLGKIGDVAIIEVPKDTSYEQIDLLRKGLAGSGVNGLIVTEGIRFLRLRTCSPAEEESIAAKAFDATVVTTSAESAADGT